MSSFPPDIMQFVWILIMLISGPLQIVAAAFFLRHRGFGPWVMIITACFSFLVSIAHHLVIFIGNSRQLWEDHSGIPLHVIMQGLGLIGSFSGILFSTGLLITALRLRAISARVAQLESIIETRDFR